MSKKAIIGGAIFGLIAPFVGIFLGLQVSTILGNILAFPIIGVSAVVGVPFGLWPLWGMIGALLLSIVVWALVFGLISLLVRSVR